MARNTITLTNAYPQIAVTAASIRVQTANRDTVIAFNETASDTNAFKVTTSGTYILTAYKGQFSGRIMVSKMPILASAP
jgi:hypothetical protein